MSDPDGGGISEQPLVLLACALGRLGVDVVSGELSVDSHQLLADSLSQQAVTPAKQARQHLKAILKKGAHKLQPGQLSSPLHHSLTQPTARFLDNHTAQSFHSLPVFVRRSFRLVLPPFSPLLSPPFILLR